MAIYLTPAVKRPVLRVAVIAGCVGLLAVAVVSAIAFARPQGASVLPGKVLLYDLDEVLDGNTRGSPVFCDFAEHVCIPRPLEGEPLVALFAYDTRPAGEHGRGCAVAVHEAEFMQTRFGVASFGFRDPCYGSTYDRLGRLVFGPAPRDLDRLDVHLEGDEVVVDTRSVTCSPPRNGAPGYGCPPAVSPD